MEENEVKEYSKVPAKVGFWSSFKSFALHPIVVELSPYQQKVFKEVSNFWNQEIYFDKGFHLRPRTVYDQDEPELKVSL